MHRKTPLHVFVLIDGLGWRVIENRGFLEDLLPYRTSVRTVLGFSSGAIPTILTGAPPSVTGHWNLFYYDPEGSPFRWLRHFSALPDRLLANRVSRRIIKEMGRRVLGLGPLFECCVTPRLLPWFNWVEKDNIYEPGGIAGAPSIFDRLTEQRVPYRAYSYHRGSDQEIVRRARRDMESREANFFFLYLSELDGFLHLHCDDAVGCESCLDRYAGALRELFDVARSIDEDASFTITSDHGMTPIRHQVDLVTQIEKLRFAMPEDYLAVYDSTMARFWFFNERAEREIVQCLDSMTCGRRLSDDELRQLGIFFPDRRFGEVIFLLQPGWLISRSDFNGGSWMPSGMHGYHPDDASSDAVFLSNREPARELTTLADVYPYLREAAGLTVPRDPVPTLEMAG